MEKVEVFFGNDLTPIGEFILLRFEKDLRPLISGGGIIEPNKKDRFLARVIAFGDKIDVTLNFDVGDYVIFNEFDIKYIENHKTGQVYGIIKPTSVMATYKVEDEDDI